MTFPVAVMRTCPPRHPVIRNALKRAMLMLQGAATIALSGCSSAPAQNIFGSFFPSWLMSTFYGILIAGVIRAILGYAKLNEAVPAPLLTYSAIALAMTLAIWLIWFGH